MSYVPVKFALTALSATVTGLLLSGCVVRETTYVEERPRRERIVVQEQPRYQPAPVVIVEGPPPPTRVVIVQEAPRDQLVVVRRQPPADIVERIPAQPSRNHVWTAGYWHAQRDQWVWVSGRWALPPRPNAVYVKPHWESRGDEFHFSVGVWR